MMHVALSTFGWNLQAVIVDFSWQIRSQTSYIRLLNFTLCARGGSVTSRSSVFRCRTRSWGSQGHFVFERIFLCVVSADVVHVSPALGPARWWHSH